MEHPSGQASQRRCAGLPESAAPSKRKKSEGHGQPRLEPLIQFTAEHLLHDFKGCEADVRPVPRRVRLVQTMDELSAGANRQEMAGGLPSKYLATLNYSQMKAPLTAVGADPSAPGTTAACAKLAKALVDYGEATTWTAKKTSGHWNCQGNCEPAGPPMVVDLLHIYGEEGVYSDVGPERHQLRKQIDRVLLTKGIQHRMDLLGGNPTMAQKGTYTFRDPPLVKFARAGNLPMVTALLDAGAPVDLCLMWVEEHWAGYKTYQWRGDSALMAAAREGHGNVCRVLLEHGASREHRCCYDDDMYDRSPSDAARRSGHPEMAALIDGFGEAAAEAASAHVKVETKGSASLDGNGVLSGAAIAAHPPAAVPALPPALPPTLSSAGSGGDEVLVLGAVSADDAWRDRAERAGVIDVPP